VAVAGQLQTIGSRRRWYRNLIEKGFLPLAPLVLPGALGDCASAGETDASIGLRGTAVAELAGWLIPAWLIIAALVLGAISFAVSHAD